MYDAVILSDLHLGSPICLARRLTELLNLLAEGAWPTRRLILNGDLFDSSDLRRLSNDHWKALSILRKLPSLMEVIWVAGNHDESALPTASLFGLTPRHEVILESGGERLLVLHGHQFDEFITAHPRLTEVADRVYRFLQWIDPSHRFAKMAKKGSKAFLRNAERIAKGARELASERGCTGVVCGHTHHAVHEPGEPGYFNSGCWTELPGTFLTVRNGSVELVEHRSEKDEARKERRRVARIVH
jgi:UDP-2,3-diacylglucosamine pyrophosphatase LpxH